MKLLSIFVVLGLGLQLTACSEDSANSQNQGTIASRDKVAYIDSVDSANNTITLDGVSYDVSSVIIEYNNNISTLNTLEAGMKVDVDIENNRIVEIDLEPTVAGKIQSIDANTINVSGAVFTYDNSAQNLAVGDDVFVFTRVQGTTTIVTSVAKTSMIMRTELEGTVSNLDSVNRTFTLLGMTVDYSNARIDTDEVIANNSYVEVLGQVTNNILYAQEIDVEDDEDYQNTEIEGVITWVANNKNAFEVDNHIRINIDQNTVFDNGMANNLTVNTLVSVDLVSSNNQLLAKEIDFDDDQNTGGTGGTAGNTQEFTISGTATVSGSTIIINSHEFATNASTEFKDGLTLQNIPGRTIEIEGVTATEVNFAKEIEVGNNAASIDLEGRVQNNQLWSYSAIDNSLATFNGRWVSVECQLNGNELFNCVLDD